MIFLYRINGGQVLGVSVNASAYAGIDPTYFATITDPPEPNGIDLSIPKIYDGTNLRNATAAEITNFTTAAATDLNLQNRAAAIGLLQTNLINRKILGAIVGLTVQQLNVLRAQATNPTLSPLTQSQVVTAIENSINAGTFD